MAKVTSKLQVTIPKALADQYGIKPGADIEWIPAGDSMRIVVGSRRGNASIDRDLRLRLFDAATQRQRRREAAAPRPPRPRGRGWRREDSYHRGLAG